MAVNKVVRSDGTTLIDISDTTAVASDVARGEYFYTADGTKTAGTASSTPSATAHTIYFEFSDGSDTTITAYYDSTFISDAITATAPTTYGGKTVTLAELDNVTWYEPANIPLNTELIDYTKYTANSGIEFGTGDLYELEWYYVSDFTPVDPTMTFSFKAGLWTNIGVYNSSKNTIKTISVYDIGTPDPDNSNLASGTLTDADLTSSAAYVRLTSTGMESERMSLIRTA